jgi:hypothetical protein
MNTTPASTRMIGLLPLFDLQTNYFERALEGIDQKDAQQRLGTQANHIAWLAGSLVHQRFLMISETHPGNHQQGEELFKNNQGIQAGATYPTLAEYVDDWKKVSPMAREGLLSITDQKLDSLLDMGGMKMTYIELITFSTFREASIIGQIALWRRLLGYPGMRYD